MSDVLREVVPDVRAEIGAKTLNNKMSQLEIFREGEQRVMSLTLSRLFVSKMTTRRRQGGDACSAIGCSNARNKYSCFGKSFFQFPKVEAK